MPLEPTPDALEGWHVTFTPLPPGVDILDVWESVRAAFDIKDSALSSDDLLRLQASDDRIGEWIACRSSGPALFVLGTRKER